MASTQPQPRSTPDPNRATLDKALADSFPASDPPACTQTLIAGDPAEHAFASPPVQVYVIAPRDEVEQLLARSYNERGGRWTSPGRRVLYASLSPASSLLECMVGIEGRITGPLCMVHAHLPNDGMLRLDMPPAGWRERPYRDDVRAAGDAWLDQKSSLALRVPSAICPHEFNVLINLEHPDIDKFVIVGVEDLPVDPRLRV